ncbi:MAG: DUF3396 domain-containing protein [Gammaproteobacteria bacterium]|nr:MAG: DUF3396 domain-containing protein [Gammaproteobacteria bacterium]
MTTFQDLENLVSDYQYVDDDRIVLTVGIVATFYFWGGHKASVRAGLVDCVEAFEAAYGSELAWAFDTEKHKAVPFNKMPPLRQLVRSMDEDDQIEWFAASGDIETATEYRISALTERGWQSDQISMVSFALPRDHAYIPEKREKLLELVYLFADTLAPFHGHVGLGAVSTYEQHLYQSDEIDVATRYRGVFIEDVFHSNWAQTGFTSIDWITFIGATLAERAGGIPELGQQLKGKNLDVKTTATGLFVASSSEPEIAPVDQETLPQLSAINSVLRPLRTGNVGSMGFGSIDGELRFNRCTSDLWVRRYDAADIWPPAAFIGLPRTPVGKVPRKKIKLKTGETCTVHGRYRHPAFEAVAAGDDDDAPQVVLMPGDVAPHWLKLGPHGEYLGRDAVTWELVAEL